MPKKNAAKQSSSKTPTAVSAQTGVKMRGCDVMVRCLENLGVDTIFAYPGGASMELHHGLIRSKKIRTILPRHEQGGAFMTHGYSRSTGKPGVCAQGVMSCTGGEIQCIQNIKETPEICNGLDDDCNNQVDDNCLSAEAAAKVKAGEKIDLGDNK